MKLPGPLFLVFSLPTTREVLPGQHPGLTSSHHTQWKHCRMASYSSLQKPLPGHNPGMEILNLIILWALLTCCNGDVLILINKQTNTRHKGKEGIQNICILKQKDFLLLVHPHKTVLWLTWCSWFWSLLYPPTPATSPLPAASISSWRASVPILSLSVEWAIWYVSWIDSDKFTLVLNRG